MIVKTGSSFDDSEGTGEEHDEHDYTIKLFFAFSNKNRFKMGIKGFPVLH
jgi:hypothetical protein